MTVNSIAMGTPLGATAASSDFVRLPSASPVQNVARQEPSSDFSEVLGSAIAGVAQQLRNAEVVSMAGIKGIASTQDVVEQVMKAEQTLQTSIAIRDKIVSAYLEISRMQI